MANDGKLYIIVTDKLPGGMDGISGGVNTPNNRDNESTLERYAQHRFFNFIESQTRQALRYTLGNIGNFTGDYIAQEQVNNALSAISFLENVGVATLAGARFGPVGAAIGATIAVAGAATSQGLSIYTGYLENTRQNYAIAQLRTRAGLNGTNNGSRGTEY